MTTGIEDIQKALDGSEMLELSSDRQSVRRVTEMRKKDDIDEYMVYVVRKKSHEAFIIFAVDRCLNAIFVVGSLTTNSNTRNGSTTIQAIWKRCLCFITEVPYKRTHQRVWVC